MKQSALVRKTPLRATKPMQRGTTRMKSKPRKQTAITKSARSQECTMNLPGVCSYDTEKVVWAHSNRSADGKGAGLKAEDQHGAYACYECHAVYDRQASRPPGMSLEYVEDRFTEAMEKSREILRAKKLIA